MNLREDQIERYAHHILNKKIGGEGQRKILESSVLIIGLGGLGSPVLYYLAAAGVGKIGLADFDIVDVSNLQRQIIYFTGDVGKNKTASSAKRICALNPDSHPIINELKAEKDNIEDLISNYDFIIDCSDNFETKYLINDACTRLKKPFSHAGMSGFEGQTFTHINGSPCLRCIFADKPSEKCVRECKNTGTIGASIGILGSIQALEAIKYITDNISDLLTTHILTIDTLSMQFKRISINKDPHCPSCGNKTR